MALMDASEMNALYTRLNTVRKNHGLSTITGSFTANTATTSTGIGTLASALNKTTTDSKYITDKTYDFGDYSVGKPCMRTLYSTMETVVDSFESTCIYDGVNSYDGNDDSIKDYSCGYDHDKSDRNVTCSGDIS